MDLHRLFRLCLPIVVLIGIAATVGHAEQTPQVAAKNAPTLVLDGLGKGAAALDGPWQFHIGDDPAWSAPGFDDSHWEQLEADKTWGVQGHASYEGYAWYRRHITLSPAPGASPDFALLIPAIDDVYQLYWNGQPIGHLGQMPPHWVQYSAVPAQTFGLGPVRSGVLAVRVWKSPLFSTDDGTAGGFESAPFIGSPEAIAASKGALDFGWLRGQQFRFGLTGLYALVAVLSLLAWLRDRREWLLFWMSVFALNLVLEQFLGGLRLPCSSAVLTFFAQFEISVRELSLWFLLLWLLQLQENRKLVSLTRKAAAMSVTAAILDGALILVYPALLTAIQVEIIDAALTPIVIAFEAIPAILVAYAFILRKRLDSVRWVVATVAFFNSMIYFVQNFASQGTRFTHWTFVNKMTGPLFTFNGNPINIITVFRTLLFLSIVYAVVRYSIENRRRQAALEQEFQNARELQQVLVPDTLPAVPGFTVTSAYRPAQEVGGDFFQIIPLDKRPVESGSFAEGSTLVILGDVSGKGLRAAMAVSLIVGAVRALAEDYPDPAQLLTQLNRRLCGRLQGGFATCVALRLDRDGNCTVSSAGHPAPFLNKREMNICGALPLGIDPSARYEEATVRLGIGDHFALYTDGLLEARSLSGELYGFERLEALFAETPSASKATEAAVNFGQDDDITVLTLMRLATGEESTLSHIAPVLTPA